jgi:hypothetical protein
MAVTDDRRKRKRMALHWPVRLFRGPAAGAIESTTENLSSEGLYCMSSQPFKVGERLQCEIRILGTNFSDSEPRLHLHCHVTVKRVERLRSGFGLGCHIEDYSLGPGSANHLVSAGEDQHVDNVETIGVPDEW